MLWRQVVKEQEVKNPLSRGLERLSTQAKAARRLPAGEGGAQSLRLPRESPIQRPIMGGKVEEVKRSAHFLKRPRLAETGAKSTSCERVHGLNNLVHCPSPPPASHLPKSDRPGVEPFHLQGENYNGQVEVGTAVPSSDQRGAWTV